MKFCWMNFPSRCADISTGIEFFNEPDSQAAALLDVMQEIQNTVGDSVSVSLTASDASELIAQSETAAEDGVKLGSVKKLLTTAHRVYAPVGSDDAKSVHRQRAENRAEGTGCSIFTV